MSPRQYQVRHFYPRNSYFPDHYVVRHCPKQICQGRGERSHYITKCGQVENAVMAIDKLGRTSTDDDSPVCSEADVEAYTTLEIKTGECLV